MNGKKITVIGAAIVDILVGGVDKGIFEKGSVPMTGMEISCGGDALNEAVIMADLGLDVELVSLVGDDEASKMVLKCLHDRKINTDKVTISGNIKTGTNIVLVDDKGERYFITNPDSSLRKLSKDHIMAHVDSMGDIVSFASIFVSPMLPIADMADVFMEIKKKPGRILIADMTTAKKCEKIQDIEPILQYIDYIIPNAKEAALLTGEADPKLSAKCFIEHGAKAVIIKCGKDGAIYRTEKEEGSAKAFPATAIDTTGAGDSFVAGFAYGLSKRLPIEDCCSYGCATASIIVEHMGAHGIKITQDEVEKRR